MSVSGVSGSGTSAASYLSSPAVQLAQLRGSAMATLFSPASGEPSDLASLMPTLVATSLYQQPGLLAGLTQWDGSMTSGSERAATAAAAAAAPPAVPAPPQFSFNPFDQSSWGTQPTGSTLDTTA